MEEKNKLAVLGCRGSMPRNGKEYLKYGGATSSFYLQAGDTTIIFDAGTGILNSTALMEGAEESHLLLSHMHIDHIQGLAFWRPPFTKGKKIRIYSEKRGGRTTKEQLQEFLRPPYWPIGTDIWQAEMEFRDIACGESFSLGSGVTVQTMRSNHPNTCTLFRVDWDGKSVVYGLDFEHSLEANGELAQFAKGCDVLIYDGTYLPEDYPRKKGWGHSTWLEALKMKEATGAKKLLLAHHEIDHTDEFLDSLQRKLTALDKDVYLAREGMEIIL